MPVPRAFALASLALALAAPMAGQTVFLQETFDSASFPPPGWVEKNNGNSLGWEPLTSAVLQGRHAFHDDFYGWNDNRLLSPSMDLRATASAWLHAEQSVSYATWRDHHYVEVSLDGGQTFTIVLDDFSPNGTSSILVNLAAYAGLNGVQISFRYTGDYASEWSVDSIFVTDTSGGPPPAVLGTATNPANGHEYQLIEASDWNAASDLAVNLGGTLACMSDAAENAWLLTTFGNWGGVRRDLWIGLSDALQEGTWRWPTGEPVGFTNWKPGQPDNGSAGGPGGEDYVVADGFGSLYAGKWSDYGVAGPSGGAHGVVELGGLQLSASPLVAGQVATFEIREATAGGLVYLAYSLAGGGPTSTPWGIAALTSPYTIVSPVLAGAGGVARLYFSIPKGARGREVWLQAFDGTRRELSNGLAETIQ